MLDGRTRSSGGATQDPCDQGGFLVQFKPFFGADEILAKDTGNRGFEQIKGTLIIQRHRGRRRGGGTSWRAHLQMDRLPE